MPASTLLPWIARALQLPQPNQRVLVYVPSSWLEITVATYKPSNASKSAHMFVMPDSHGVDRYVKGVTHWMPLPAPPTAADVMSNNTG